MPSALVIAEAAAAGSALAIALALRPWRCIDAQGPPWPWVIVSALLPFLWTLDRVTGVTVLPPWSGAPALVLMAGWPLAVLLLLPLAFVAAIAGALPWAEALQRLFWLGLVPATLTLALGALLRNRLPRRPAVYLIGRGVLGPLLTCSVCALGYGLAFGPAGAGASVIAPLLAAFGESALTALLVLLGVACRPRWLATWSDRLYRWPAH